MWHTATYQQQAATYASQKSSYAGMGFYGGERGGTWRFHVPYAGRGAATYH